MIVIMNPSATMRDKSAVIARAEDLGFKVHLSEGKERTIIGIIGNDRVINREQIELMTGVERVVPILKPFKLASREFKASDTVFPLGSHTTVSYTHLDVYKRQVLDLVGAQADDDATGQYSDGGRRRPALADGGLHRQRRGDVLRVGQAVGDDCALQRDHRRAGGQGLLDL